MGSVAIGNISTVGRPGIDETGNRYGRLTVLSLHSGGHNAVWLCRCDCGNTAHVVGTHLRRRNGTVSCGCHRREQGVKRIRAVATAQVGELHPGWKDEDVGYGALHVWLKKHKIKTGVCSDCGQERYTEWANVHPERKRSRDLDDYVEVCKPCHMRMDGHPWLRSQPELDSPA